MRNRSEMDPGCRFAHPGYDFGENYYGAGIDSRLEMLRPRMS